MKLSELIKEKIPLFTKIKYFDIFSNILSNIKTILINEKKSKIKLIFGNEMFEIEKKDTTDSIEEKCKKYIQKIENSILKNIYYKGIKLSEIEFLYLKNLAINYKRKIDLIAIQKKKKKDYILIVYLQLCKKEILLNNNIKNSKLYLNKKNSFLNNKEIIISEEEEKKNINIYIGKFNMKKFLDKEQIIKFQKGEFVNGYIFNDKFDKLNGKPFNFRDFNLNKKKERFSNNQGSPNFYSEKGKKNVHKFNSITFDKYSVPLSLIKEIKKQKEFGNKEHKMKVKSTPNIKINDNYFYHDNKNIMKSENNNKSSRIRKTCLEKRLNTDINSFPKLKKNSSQRIIIKSRNKIKLKNYFSSNDLYY